MAPGHKARLFSAEMIDIPTLSYTSIRDYNIARVLALYKSY